MSACRSCGAPIEWIKLKSGKACPVDVQNITVTHPPETLVRVGRDGIGEVIKYDYGDGLDIINYDYHRSHFATCPHADDWRSKPESKAKKALREECEKQENLEWKK